MGVQSWDWNPGSDVLCDPPFSQWWLRVLLPCPESRGWKLVPLASLSLQSLLLLGFCLLNELLVVFSAAPHQSCAALYFQAPGPHGPRPPAPIPILAWAGLG